MIVTDVPDTPLNRRLEAAWKKLRACVSPEAVVQIEDTGLDALVGPISQLGRLMIASASAKSSNTGIVLIARDITRVPAVEGIVALKITTSASYQNAQILDIVQQPSLITVALEVKLRDDVKAAAGSKTYEIKR